MLIYVYLLNILKYITTNSCLYFLYNAITVEHQIIHYIKCSCFSQGRTNSQKLHVGKLGGGDSHSSSANIKLIASAVEENFFFLSLSL